MAHSLFLFVPAFGQMISATTFLTTHALQQALSQKGIAGGVSTLSFPDIGELRSMATTIWFDSMPQSSHMLYIDADMGFSPDLIMDMLLLDEPIVGAIYRQRREPVSWAGSGTGETSSERRGGFMRVEGVGMGCTLIRRDAVAKMVQAYPELIDTRIHLHPAKDTLKSAGTDRILRLFDCMDIPERGRVSEDLSFCMRWNALGGTVWAAIGHVLSHVGPYDYRGSYLDEVMRQQAEKAAAEAALAAQAAPSLVPQLSPANVTAQVVGALWPNLSPDAKTAADVLMSGQQMSGEAA